MIRGGYATTRYSSADGAGEVVGVVDTRFAVPTDTPTIGTRLRPREVLIDPLPSSAMHAHRRKAVSEIESLQCMGRLLRARRTVKSDASSFLG